MECTDLKHTGYTFLAHVLFATVDETPTTISQVPLEESESWNKGTFKEQPKSYRSKWSIYFTDKVY